MAIKIKIATVDKSSVIDYKSVLLNRALTNQVDTLTFRINRADSSGYKPDLLDDIQVIDEDGTTVIFGGQIVEMNEVVDGLLEYVQISAKDYSFDMDRMLVVQVYEDMTVDDIIADIKANFLDASYDISNVNCPITLKYIAFNYEYPSKCLQQLAQITNYDWYVDDTKQIFFFLKGSTPATFNLTDTNQKFKYNSLVINKDIKNLRNSIIVRGGEYLGALSSESVEADGDQTTFLQAYRYNSVTVTVNAVSKTVGIANLDDPTAFDCLYNFQEKAVIFPTATKPTSGQIVTVGGYPYIPVVTKLTNAPSIATYGEFQFKIVDKSINSKEAARDRARAEITQWANQIDEGSFKTNSSGLKVGQNINIQSTIRGIDQSFIISRISSKMDTHDRFVHTVTLVTSQTYGMVEFLQNMLMEKDKQITVAQDEVLDTVLGLEDELSLSDSVAVTSVPNDYYWEPSGSSDTRWNFFTWA